MTKYTRSFALSWNELTLCEQMANIGAEVGRAINWRKKGNYRNCDKAFYRALELIDFSSENPLNRRNLKELLRVREILVDFFSGDNIYQSTEESWEKYFYYFNYAARNLRGL